MFLILRAAMRLFLFPQNLYLSPATAENTRYHKLTLCWARAHTCHEEVTSCEIITFLLHCSSYVEAAQRPCRDVAGNQNLSLKIASI